MVKKNQPVQVAQITQIMKTNCLNREKFVLALKTSIKIMDKIL
jgi:hypothetical protein